MIEIIIEKAIESDLVEILVLQKLAYIQEAAIYNNFNISPLTQTLESVLEDFKVQDFHKACIEGKIIGSVKAYEKNGIVYIGKLIVHPGFQNKGIGKQLMFHVESQFPMAKKFELFTAHKSLKNLHLYHKLGFTEFKRESLAGNPNMVFLEKWT
jgi:ribosomal protein S18 acetylase RimI-like enzyme